jgi:hypothetical protein
LKLQTVLLALSLCAAMLLLLHFLLFPRSLDGIWAEDSLVESLQSVFYGIAAGGQLLMFLGLSRGQRRNRRRVFHLLLFLVFLFVAMEEISWGQRIFGWDTPPFLEDLNLQGETNVHNIFGGAFSPFHLAMMVFINGFCYLLPLGYHLSERIRALSDGIGLPVIGIDLIALFIIADLLRPLDLGHLDAQATAVLSVLPMALYLSGRAPLLFRGVEVPKFQVTSILLVGMMSLLLSLSGYGMPQLWLWESRELLFGLGFLSYTILACLERE